MQKPFNNHHHRYDNSRQYPVRFQPNQIHVLYQIPCLRSRASLHAYIFSILYSDLFIRIDILIKDGNKFKLIEVKAKSYHSEMPEILGAKGDLLTSIRPYIEDVAFQAYVFSGAFPQTEIKTFLMMPDKAIVCDVDGLN